MQFSVDIKMEDIITELKFAGSYGEVIEFVKALDEKIADSEFTDRLIEALKPAVQEYEYIVFVYCYDGHFSKTFATYEEAHNWGITKQNNDGWEIRRLHKDV